MWILLLIVLKVKLASTKTMASNYAQKRFMVIEMSRGQVARAALTAPTWILIKYYYAMVHDSARDTAFALLQRIFFSLNEWTLSGIGIRC
jgi:hypothetical protein